MDYDLIKNLSNFLLFFSFTIIIGYNKFYYTKLIRHVTRKSEKNAYSMRACIYYSCSIIGTRIACTYRMKNLLNFSAAKDKPPKSTIGGKRSRIETRGECCRIR